MMKLPIEKIVLFYRKQKNLTQNDLAEKLLVSEKTISAYETGKRKIATEVLEQIAIALDMKIQDFFNEEKISDDIRKSKIKEVAVTITKEYGNNQDIIYWAEVDVPETGEILEEWTSGFFKTFEEAEEYIENVIEKKYKVLHYHENDLTHIIDVEYVSVWDDGYAEFATKAKYDTERNLVFDIEAAETDGIDIEHLDREYVLFPDGTEKDVVPIGDEDEYEEELKNKTMVRADY